MSKYMTLAQNNAAFAKIGIYGDAGSGKSRTSAEIAIGLHKFIKSTKPVAMFDTEPGHQFLIPLFKKADIEFLAFDKSRSFIDLMGWMEEATKMCDIGIVDSISHVWRELQLAYLTKINEKRPDHKQITRLEFQHWGPIKSEWGKFTDLFLTSKMHMIVCGRAGSIYEYQENDKGKRELITTGTKMATEKEMGYEPSLLIEMIKDHRKNGPKRIINMCVIEKDRADLLNGQEFEFPTFETFKPHFQYLNIGGEHFDMERTTTSKDLFTADGDDGWNAEKRRRVILCEEIQGLITKHIPGQAAVDKQRKVELLERHFSTKSWTKVENMRSDELAASYRHLLTELEPNTKPIAEDVESLSSEEAASLDKGRVNV